MCVYALALLPREFEVQRSVLQAQLSAQAAAIQQEREALLSQRISTDMLTSLSEQVGLLRGSGWRKHLNFKFVTLKTSKSFWVCNLLQPVCNLREVSNKQHIDCTTLCRKRLWCRELGVTTPGQGSDLGCLDC